MTDSSKNPVEVMCDGGGTYGFGHIRRSYTLAKALKERDYPVKFSVISDAEKKFTPYFNSTSLDPVIQIFDLPYEIEPLIMEANKRKLRSIALDYFGDGQPSLTISIYEHRIPSPSGRRFAGLKYAIVRPEILQYAPAKPGENVVVMIGGSDLNRVGESVALLLSQEGQIVELIQGPVITKDYSINLPNVTILCTPKTLEINMAKCAWAVTNGGGSMMEMMCLGKAVHVLPQTNDERLLAQIALDKGAILGIGLESLQVPSSADTIRVGKLARQLVDGRGLERIIKIIEDIDSE